MSGRLDGKIAVVTGAGEGQGKAVALLFAKEGAKVIAGDISGKQDDTAAEEGGGNITPVQCDVSVPEQVEAMVKEATSRHGRLDIMCNVAGIALHNGMIEDEDPDRWDRVQDVNLKGIFLGMKYGATGDREERRRVHPELGVDRWLDQFGHVARLLGVEGRRHQPHEERGHPVQPQGRPRQLHLPGLRPHANDRQDGPPPDARGARADPHRYAGEVAVQPGDHGRGDRGRRAVPQLRRGGVHHRGGAAGRRRLVDSFRMSGRLAGKRAVPSRPTVTRDGRRCARAY